MKKKSYPKEFKENVVKYLRESGLTITQVAKQYDVERSLLSRWNSDYDKENAFPGQGNARDKEVAELKRKLAAAEERCEILKKAMAIFSQ